MSKAPQVIDSALIRELAQVLNDTNLTEIEVEHETLRIRVAREIQVQTYAPVQMQAAPSPALAPAAVAAPAPPAKADVKSHPGLVTSPMVGTAYRKPSPEAANLCEIGQVVKAGDKLLLIEAMKTFNDIVAPKAGTITQIIFTDGRPVEFGEPLLIIE